MSVSVVRSSKIASLITLVEGKSDFSSLSVDEISSYARVPKKELFKHLQDEASRLNLEIDITPDEDGWWDIRWWPKELRGIRRWIARRRKERDRDFGYGI